MGETLISLAIAGFVVDGEFDKCMTVDEQRLPFVTSGPGQAKVRVRTHQDVRELPARIAGIVMEGKPDWDVVQLSDGKVAVSRHSQRAFQQFLLVFQLGSSDVDLHIFPGQLRPVVAKMLNLTYPFRFPVMELLRKHRGFILHGCGVRGAERGWLFLGPSGVGKTTMGRLWERAGEGVVLNDEYTVVRELDGHSRVFGTPWLGSGRLCSADSEGLDRVIILEHGAENRLVPVEPVEALKALWPQLYLPLWSQEGMDATLGTGASLVQRVSFFRYSFVPHEDAVEFLVRELG